MGKTTVAMTYDQVLSFQQIIYLMKGYQGVQAEKPIKGEGIEVVFREKHLELTVDH